MIEVIHNITKEARQVYVFAEIDNRYAVFTNFYIQEKLPGEIKWRSVDHWDKYLELDSTIPEPILPEDIRSQALAILVSKAKILTWSEYKPNEP